MPTKSTAATPARAKAGATAVSDSGVAGPGSASEKLVATKVENRASTGVSNSPTRSGLPPGSSGAPSRGGGAAGGPPGPESGGARHHPHLVAQPGAPAQ